MAVSKNLMVRVGADLSQLKSGMSQGKGAVREFAQSYTTSMSKAGASLASIDAEIIGDKIKEAKKILKDQMNQKDLWAASGITADSEGSLGAAYQELAYSIHETRTEIAGLLAEQQALKEGGKQVSPLTGMVAELRELETAQGLTKNRQELRDISSALDIVNGKIREYVDSVSGEGGAGIGVQLEQAKAGLKAMENAGLGAGDSEWDSQYIEVQRLTQQVKEYKAALTEVPVSIWNRIGNGARTAYAAIASGARTALKGVRTVASGVKSLGSRLLEAGKTGLRAMGQVAGRIFGVGRSANSASGGMGKLMKSIRNVGIVALGLRFMRGLFGELQGIISSYVQENTALQGQISALKNGMGQALAPAINLVTNALAVLMPYIIGVSNAIGTLMANLFGSGWTTVAAGANAAADATKAAAGAQADYNRTLAGFDEITKLDKNSGGGGSGGAADSVTTAIQGAMPTWLTDLTGQIKAAIDAGDWYGIGEILAGKLGDAVDTATAFIESGAVKEKIFSFTRKTTSVINGFFDTLTFEDTAGQSIAEATGGLIGDGIALALDTLDRFLAQIHWDSIGTTVSQFFNGGIQSLKEADTSVGGILGGAISSGIELAKSAVSTFDWNSLGSLVGTNINNLFSRIDWAGAGSSFSTGVKGVLGSITTAMQEVDWSQVGSSIKTALSNVDWKGIAAGMAKAAGTAVGGLGTAIWEAIKDGVEDAYAFFQAEIEAAGGNVMEGIWNGVKKAVGNVGTWIKDNIFTPFVEGFKSTFSIHSPSTNGEIVGLGKNVMLGILNGFLEPLKNIGSWVKEKVFTPIKDAFDKAFGEDSLLGGLFGGGDSEEIQVTAKAKITDVEDYIQNKTLGGFIADLTKSKDKLTNKTLSGYTADLTKSKDSITNKTLGSYTADLTKGKDSITDRTLGNYTANLTKSKDSITSKTLGSYTAELTASNDKIKSKALSNYTANLAYYNDNITATKSLKKFNANVSSFTDNLSTRSLSLSANVALNKGGYSTIEQYLGLTNLWGYLSVSTPTLTPYTVKQRFGGYEVEWVKGFNIAWNAKGGILDGAQLFGMAGNTLLGGGEAGREAVLPLDRNTWWMDKIADKVVNRMTGGGQSGDINLTVTVPLDGKTIAQKTIQHINAQARATGMNPLAAYL